MKMIKRKESKNYKNYYLIKKEIIKQKINK